MTFNILLTYGAQSIGQTSQSPYSIFLPTSKGCFIAEVTNNISTQRQLIYYISTRRPGIESISHRANHIFLHINYIQKDNMMHVFL